jgi:hypothetical protein
MKVKAGVTGAAISFSYMGFPFIVQCFYLE